MKRIAFRMRLKQGCEAEYKARHDAIWPEVAEVIRQSGARNYSIFRCDLDLFAYLELDEGSQPDPWAREVHPLLKRWWDTIGPLVECNPDNSPVVWPMDEMFHLN